MIANIKLIIQFSILSLFLTGCGKTNDSSIIKEKQDYNVAISEVKIDTINFPDVYFRTYIQDVIDKNHDDCLSDKEIFDTKKISINGLIDEKYSKIESFKGIECFDELKELDCQNCSLIDIDVSKNVKIESLILHGTNINKLNVSNNIYLKQLDCSSSDVNSLDVSYNINLERLEIYRTNIDNIDLSKNLQLIKFDCSRTKIKELDLSNNLELMDLGIGYTEIETIDLTNNTNLHWFNCYSVSSLKKLNLLNNRKLGSIVCAGTEISELDLSNCNELFEVRCNNDTVILGCDDSIVERE